VNTAETSYQPENSNKAISRHVEGQISGHFCSERAVSMFKPALRMGIQNGSESALIGEQVVVRFWVGRHWITAGRIVQSKKCLRDSGAARLARVTNPEDSSCVAETPFLFSTFTVLCVARACLGKRTFLISKRRQTRAFSHRRVCCRALR
jgi:hypothetical protein